jgi:hypothetical protein
METMSSIATLDLRIDYMRPATPRQPVFARAECFRKTHSIAFVRGSAYHESPDDPIATTIATFVLSSNQSRKLFAGSEKEAEKASARRGESEPGDRERSERG